MNALSILAIIIALFSIAVAGKAAQVALMLWNDTPIPLITTAVIIIIGVVAVTRKLGV